MRKPFFWKRRQRWYVKSDDGKSQICLGEDEVEAYRIWQGMVAAGASSLDRESVAALTMRYINDGLGGGESHQERVAYYLTQLAEHCKANPSIDNAGSLTAKQVETWMYGRKEWGPSSHRGVIQAIKACWKWAHQEGLIARNRMVMATPEPTRREGIITDEQHAAMCLNQDEGRVKKKKEGEEEKPPEKPGKPKKRKKTRDGALRAVLIALKHSGTRPGMIRSVTAENVRSDLSQWVLTNHKTRKKTKAPLVVWLDPCLQTLTRILLSARKTGPLFLDSSGKPWSKDVLGRRIGRIREKLGIPKSVVAYSHRHRFATKALESGVGIATVAQLIGHSDITMISRVYGHLDKANDYMKSEAAKVWGKNQPE